MDPQMAWNEMLEAIEANDLFEAGIRADGLLNWLEHGGFPPKTVSRVLPGEWNRLICRYLCNRVMLALQTLRE